MGDSRKAIDDDEDDWIDLQRAAGIFGRLDASPYSLEARAAKDGFRKGYKNEVLLAFISKESQVAALNYRISELHEKFEKYAELSASFQHSGLQNRTYAI